MVVTQFYTYAKIYQAIHLGFVHFTVHMTYFTTGDKKSRSIAKVCSGEDFLKIWYLES